MPTTEPTPKPTRRRGIRGLLSGSRWKWLSMAALAALLALGVSCGLTRNAFPVGALVPAAERVPAWWERPAALTEEEGEYQRWLSAISWQLPADRWEEHWNVGGSQHGVFSIRYQAAFSGYAAAALGMRTPAYPALTRRIIENLVDRILDPRSWRYIQSYWKDEPWYPDPCAHENIMFTGHLLQLITLHEAMTGDTRYRKDGFELVWDEQHRFHYDTLSLVEMTVRQMRDSPSGGVACEPGLIFFPCNNHPHIALKLLEGTEAGDWSAEREKWEKWALSSYRSTLGGGAFKLLYHQKTRAFVPRGHPGLDGWSLLWYVPWASDVEIARKIWQIAASRIDWAPYETAPGDESQTRKTTCCNPVWVPGSNVAAFLAPAARACGDTTTAGKLESWLDRHFERSSEGRRWLDTDREWRTGVTANRLIALALENGSSLRYLVQRQLPRDYFDGPMLLDVKPDSTTVYQAYRDGGRLVLEIDGNGENAELQLANVEAVGRVEGLTRSRWSYAGDILTVPAAGRLTLGIVPGHTAAR